MRLRYLIPASLAALSFFSLFAYQQGFRQFTDEEDNPIPVPPGADEKTEWSFARLRYPSGR